MIIASAVTLLMTVADRGIMTVTRAGQGMRPPASQQPGQEETRSGLGNR